MTSELFIKTNEKVTVKLDYFGKYGQEKILTVYKHKFNDRPRVKIGKEYYFVSENGQLSL